MKLRINANSFATKRYLLVTDTYFEFCETVFAGGTRRFSYDQVDCILYGADALLSIQVGQELFRIPTKRGNDTHSQTIEALVNNVKRVTHWV